MVQQLDKPKLSRRLVHGQTNVSINECFLRGDVRAALKSHPFLQDRTLDT